VWSFAKRLERDLIGNSYYFRIHFESEPQLPDRIVVPALIDNERPIHCAQEFGGVQRRVSFGDSKCRPAQDRAQVVAPEEGSM
jgi:hypothetical protein